MYFPCARKFVPSDSSLFFCWVQHAVLPYKAMRAKALIIFNEIYIWASIENYISRESFFKGKKDSSCCCIQGWSFGDRHKKYLLSSTKNVYCEKKKNVIEICIREIPSKAIWDSIEENTHHISSIMRLATAYLKGNEGQHKQKICHTAADCHSSQIVRGLIFSSLRSRCPHFTVKCVFRVGFYIRARFPGSTIALSR